jgi:serine protease inhibitor
VTAVRQKTWMRVDEKGTEAAAVTSVDVGVTSMPPTFIADRPFLLAIRERHSGTLLFLGAMAEAPVER